MTEGRQRSIITVAPRNGPMNPSKIYERSALIAHFQKSTEI
mgnify:CR=1 FL=1